MAESPLLERYERELAWRDRGVVALVLPGDVPPHRHALPPPLVDLASRLERSPLFGGALPIAEVADELTALLWRRIRDLAARGGLDVAIPGGIEELVATVPPQDVVETIAAVVRDAFEFDPDPASVLSTVRRVADAMRGGAAIRVARRAVQGGRSRAVCLHYATALQVLYLAVKTATRDLSGTFLVPICGRALDFEARSGHAWNWLIDANARSVVVFDAVARSTWRHWNVSGLIATCYQRALVTDCEDLGMVVRALVDASTERGRTLLYHVAHHLTIPPATRRVIGAHLAAGDFDRAVPDWREQLARRNSERGPLEWVFSRADERDEALLAAIA